VSSQQIAAIRAVRQITLLCGKIFEVCSDARVEAALRDYTRVDREIPDIPEDLLQEFERTALRNFGNFFQDVEEALYHDGISPVHGPGAVANRLSQNGKWSANCWTERLESVFRAEEVLCASLHDVLDSEITYLTEDQEPPVRVIPVPKTMKTPRIIAMEPSWMMYVQQGIFHTMTQVMRRPKHDWIFNSICWETQDLNRDLCRDWESYGTLDLSEASDRVPLAVVERMFARFPLLRDAVLASRSTTAELPDGTLVPLRKFASMGSALCFPIETLVFATCVLMAGDRAGLPVHRKFRDLRPFRVYGDDIVVPLDIVPSTISVLESFGFKVNSNKSFWTGMFRESCGADWYAGYDVSVVRQRAQLPDSRLHGVRILKVIELHNRLMEYGLFSSARFLENLVCQLGYPYYAPLGSRMHALWTYDESKVVWRFNKRLHRPEIKSVLPRVIIPSDSLDGYGALRKFFYRTTERPYEEDHLERAGRSQRVAINVGWSGMH
jgi:hypothetical protein